MSKSKKKSKPRRYREARVLTAEQAKLNQLGKRIFDLCFRSKLPPEDCLDACLSAASWIFHRHSNLSDDDGLKSFSLKALAHFHYQKTVARAELVRASGLPLPKLDDENREDVK